MSSACKGCINIVLCLVVLQCSLLELGSGYVLSGPASTPNGGNVTLSWTLGVADPLFGMNVNDEIRLYCHPPEEKVDVSTNLDSEYVSKWSISKVLYQLPGQPYVLSKNGTVNIGPLINMRVPCEVLLWESRSFGRLTPHHPTTPYFITVSRGEVEPLQGHLSMTGDPTEMQITWVSGDVSGRNQSVWYMPSSQPASTATRVQAAATTYAAGDMCGDKASIVSGMYFRDPGMIYSARMENLVPNITYRYVFARFVPPYSYWYGTENDSTLNLMGELSAVFSFLSPKATNGTTPSARIVAVGDMRVWGDEEQETIGWTTTTEKVLSRISTVNNANGVDVVAIAGDLSYAGGKGFVWERFFYLLQPLATAVPVHIAIGNYDYSYKSILVNHTDASGLEEPYIPSWSGSFDHGSSGGECGVPPARRFVMPKSPGSNSVFWYSHNVANVHMVYISTEHDLSPGSVQAMWLEQDLNSVDRSAQPWIVVIGHRALYNIPYKGSNDSDILFQTYGRQYLNPLFARYGVNVFISGHYHNYVRSCALLNDQCVTKGGTVYITVGTGGAYLSNPKNFTTPPWLESYMTGVHGFITLETTDNVEASLQFHDTGGTLRDSATIAHGVNIPTTTPPSTNATAPPTNATTPPTNATAPPTNATAPPTNATTHSPSTITTGLVVGIVVSCIALVIAAALAMWCFRRMIPTTWSRQVL